MASCLRSLVEMPCLFMVWPRYWTDVLASVVLNGFNLRLCLRKRRKHSLSSEM